MSAINQAKKCGSLVAQFLHGPPAVAEWRSKPMNERGPVPEEVKAWIMRDPDEEAAEVVEAFRELGRKIGAEQERAAIEALLSM